MGRRNSFKFSILTRFSGCAKLLWIPWRISRRWVQSSFARISVLGIMATTQGWYKTHSHCDFSLLDFCFHGSDSIVRMRNMFQGPSNLTLGIWTYEMFFSSSGRCQWPILAGCCSRSRWSQELEVDQWQTCISLVLEFTGWQRWLRQIWRHQGMALVRHKLRIKSELHLPTSWVQIGP